MRKRVKMMVAAAVCVVTMLMVGCGGDDKKAVSDAPAAVEATNYVEPTEKFVGEWKLAYIECNGVTIAGDLSGTKELVGEDMSSSLTLAEDGAGTRSLGSDNGDITWALVDDNNIKITLVDDPNNKEGEPSVLDATYNDGELRLDMSEAAPAEGDEGAGPVGDVTEGVMVLTPDGKSDKVQCVDIVEATAITSENDVVGEWKLCGFGMFGLYMYGDSEGVGEMFGDESLSVSFAPGGTCNFFGSDCAYEVTDGGVTLVGEDMGANAPVLAFGDDIVIDMSAFFGDIFGSDKPLFMVYSK